MKPSVLGWSLCLLLAACSSTGTGGPRRSGSFLNRKQHGAWSYFYENGTLQASDGGAIEALAPNADLTVQGKLRTSGGCVGLAAGGALDVADADVDVPITPSCP